MKLIAKIGSLLDALLIIVVGVALIGVVAASVSTASDDGNLSVGTKALLLLLPLFFVIIIIYGAIRYMRSNN